MTMRAHQFAESIFHLDGKPFRMPYDSMRHLWDVYDCTASDMILKFGRQAHKSTSLGYNLAIPCLKYDNYRTLYVAPTGNQVSVFSSDKLNNCIHGSPIVVENYLNTQTTDQVFYKEFSNGSKIYLRSAFHSADAIRGISADSIKIDETQDIVSDHVSVIQQCMAAASLHYEQLKETYPNIPEHLFRNTTYAGTPKTVDNTMEKYWDLSTKTEWIIKCQHQGCKKYNYINEYNVGDTCLICNKCGKPIYYDYGQWVDMVPGAFIKGFRMPQIVLKWVNNIDRPKVWQISVTNFRKSETTEKFFNEVLALPYSSGKHPISAAELKDCCDENVSMVDPLNTRANKIIAKGVHTYAGIDWGKGDTTRGTSYSILSIGMWYDRKFRTVFMKKYMGKESEAIIQYENMLDIIARFNCQFTIADTGDGRTSNAHMVQELSPARFAEVYEHGTLKRKIKWLPESGHYVINRTRVMTDYFMEIKRGEVSFFKYDQFKMFQPDFTGIYQEYSEQTRMSKYDHIVPDDAFHAWMFSKIAMMIRRGMYDKYLTGGQ